MSYRDVPEKYAALGRAMAEVATALDEAGVHGGVPGRRVEKLAAERDAAWNQAINAALKAEPNRSNWVQAKLDWRHRIAALRRPEAGKEKEAT